LLADLLSGARAADASDERNDLVLERHGLPPMRLWIVDAPVWMTATAQSPYSRKYSIHHPVLVNR
jgi:hypothetical protein